LVGALRPPPHDAVAIEEHGGRTRDVAAARASAPVNQAVPARHREVRVRDEAIVDAQTVGQSLALRVLIGRHGKHFDARALGLGQLGSKTLELGHAERSPVATVENEEDRLLAPVVGKCNGAAAGVAQGEVRRALAEPQRSRLVGDAGEDEVDVGAERE